MEKWTVWATLLSPVISAIAIVVALFVARSSSKDAREQIKSIRNLLDVFVAVNNLNIVEAQRKYQQQLRELDSMIDDAQIEVDSVNPFVGGVGIDRIMEVQEKTEQIDRLNQLLDKRKEVKINLSLIQDYINKATIR